MDIEILTSADEQAYEAMLHEKADTLLYTSLKYRNLLRGYLDAEDCYLIAKQERGVIGALPLFLKKNRTYGNVLNSLPFYGSNGGVIVSPRVTDLETVIRALIEALHRLVRERDVVIATVITSPFERHRRLYEAYLNPTFRDSRVGQVACLPQFGGDIEHAIMTMIGSKRRGDIRKARKRRIEYTHSSDIEILRFLADTHRENMRAIGGAPKDWRFFRSAREIFAYDADYHVYVATLDGQLISALLVFYYNNMVEYFTPATVEKYRSLQPNSLLIFEAMKDAIHRGYRYWNFGGTWNTQDGVYHFKKRWGARDMLYDYYIITYRDIGHLLEMHPQEILAEYPFFYVVPFDLLRSREGEIIA